MINYMFLSSKINYSIKIAYFCRLLNSDTDKKEKVMIKVQIINKGHQPLPAFATPQSAGMALRANIDEAIVLHPMERRLVPTSLYMALPAGGMKRRFVLAAVWL